MRRRAFVASIGALLLLPAGGRAATAFRIGVLVLGNNDPEGFLRDFRAGLGALGYTEGQISIEVRSAGGREGLLAQMASDLVGSNIDLLIAWQTPPAHAAKQATSTIPIIVWAGDPVGTGLIASLSLPSGNITGISTASAEITGKRVGLLREIFPTMRRIAMLANVIDPLATLFVSQADLATRTLGVEFQPMMVRPDQRLDGAFRELKRTGVEAVIIQGSLLRQDVVDLALEHRLASVGDYRLLPAMGGLMSYAPNFAATCRELAVLADKVLKGRKPADLPLQQPTTFDLVINLRTAKALGLAIPDTLLARADEVIE
jgi:putative tryptophan/tyrosine transport system substrate-binding protein